jgi:hypothetical protein
MWLQPIIEHLRRNAASVAAASSARRNARDHATRVLRTAREAARLRPQGVDPIPEDLVLFAYYFDPLADNMDPDEENTSLYHEWENAGGIRTNERFVDRIPAGSVEARLVAEGNYYRLSFPGLQWWAPAATNYTPRRELQPGEGLQAARESAYRAENHRGNVNHFITTPPSIRCVGPSGDVPRLAPVSAPEFLLPSSGTHEMLIDLHPRSIVLHWNVGGTANAGAATRRAYNYHVDGRGRWRPGGEPGDESWRLWMNGLRMNNASRLPVRDGVTVDLRITERVLSYTANRRDAPPFHADGFEINTVGVSMLGMLGGTDNPHNGPPHTNGTTRPPSFGEETSVAISQSWSNPMLSRQILMGLRQVARMCKAWDLDPMDPNCLCTHYEVNRLHWILDPPGKWDITWLPYGLQAAYHDFMDGYEIGSDADEPRSLCERENGGQYHRWNDVPLNGWRSDHWPDGQENLPTDTDRVSDFLRRLVRGIMDNPDIMNPDPEDLEEGGDIFDFDQTVPEGNEAQYANEATLPFRYVRLPGHPADDRILLEPYSGDRMPIQTEDGGEGEEDQEE